MKIIYYLIKISLLALIVLAAMGMGASLQEPATIPAPPIPLSAPFHLKATPTFVISGIPTNVTFIVLHNGSPVSGAAITLSGSTTGTGITDSSGRVAISVNTTGTEAITATVSKPGYENTTYPAILTAGTIPVEEWNITLGESGATTIPYSILQTSDRGYIAAGVIQKGEFVVGTGWLIKLDAEGNVQWNRTFGQGRTFHVLQTSDGGYLIADSKSYYSNQDPWTKGYARLIKVSKEAVETGLTQAETQTETPAIGSTQILSAIPTETQIASPKEKSGGFEAALAILILLEVYMVRRK